MDLVNEVGSSRDIVCPAMEDGGDVFAMKVLPVEGIYILLSDDISKFTSTYYCTYF